MNAENLKTINDSLKPFNAFVNAMGFLIDTKKGEPTGCRVEVKKGRVRVRACKGDAELFSGPVSPETMPTFVKEFWFWEQGR